MPMIAEANRPVCPWCKREPVVNSTYLDDDGLVGTRYAPYGAMCRARLEARRVTESTESPSGKAWLG